MSKDSAWGPLPPRTNPVPLEPPNQQPSVLMDNFGVLSITSSLLAQSPGEFLVPPPEAAASPIKPAFRPTTNPEPGWPFSTVPSPPRAHKHEPRASAGADGAGDSRATAHVRGTQWVDCPLIPDRCGTVERRTFGGCTSGFFLIPIACARAGTRTIPGVLVSS